MFAAIERHRKAMREFSEALLDLVPGTHSPDPKKERKYSDRENRATDSLISTEPTTLLGLLALVSYVNSVSDGRASGKHDNCFDELLYGVLANAEKVLAEQIGRVA